jgi:hypothetical protein
VLCMTRREAWIVGLCVFSAVFCGGMLWTSTADARCASVAQCRRAIDWHRSVEHKLARSVAWQRKHRLDVAMPALREAVFIAARVYRVNPWEMISVARCESRADLSARRVSARNSATAEGAWQFLDSTWSSTPFAAFDRDNVYVQALATAAIVEREGWHQWDCKP